MSLVSSKPPQPAPQPASNQIVTEPPKGMVVDTAYDPAASLLVNVEGSPWTVDYYSQVLSTTDVAVGQSTNLDPIYQQYTRINQLMLRVTSPLSYQYDSQTGESADRGTATVYPFMAPKPGDMFVADIGDGRTAVFRVSKTERKSIFKDTTWSIDYALVNYTTPDNLKDLTSKVVKELFYQHDYQNYGQNPLLTTEQYHNTKDLADLYEKIYSKYLQEFYTHTLNCLLLPGQPYKTYDGYLMKFVKRSMMRNHVTLLQNAKVFSTEMDPSLSSPSVWDAIIDRDQSMLSQIGTRVKSVQTKFFGNKPILRNLRFQGFDNIVYFIDPAVVSDLVQPGQVISTYSDLPIDYSIKGTLGWDTTDPNGTVTGNYAQRPAATVPFYTLSTGTSLPIYPKLGQGDYYVFSQAFYQGNTTGMSLIELEIIKYFNAQENDPKVLLAAARSMQSLPQIYRFYYAPVVLFLIRAYARTI